MISKFFHNAFSNRSIIFPTSPHRRPCHSSTVKSHTHTGDKATRTHGLERYKTHLSRRLLLESPRSSPDVDSPITKPCQAKFPIRAWTNGMHLGIAII